MGVNESKHRIGLGAGSNCLCNSLQKSGRRHIESGLHKVGLKMEMVPVLQQYTFGLRLWEFHDDSVSHPVCRERWIPSPRYRFPSVRELLFEGEHQLCAPDRLNKLPPVPPMLDGRVQLFAKTWH